MCGIAGIVGPGANSEDASAILATMLDRLRHRGPDDGAMRAAPGAVLGARRLAILDVGDPLSGRQPVASARGDVVVAMNGEIYGYAAQRGVLEAEGHRFRSRCDTELALRLYEDEEDGASVVDRMEGMFALAIYDARRRTLYLARDRMGEKPLLWFETDGGVVFASEWRALAEHPEAPRDLDHDAIALYLQHRFVPAPKTAIRGVHRLPPGHLLTWRDGRIDVRPYWSLPVPPAAGAGLPRTPPASEVRRVRGLLEDAVSSRLVADVPVGVFLSGGVDSAALAAFAANAAKGGRVPTFTLRTEDPDFDEGEAARRSADALGTEHHEVVATADDLESGFDEVFASIDEPIGDSALVPTLLLSRAAREHVKVVLSGEGADELFGGYPTYLGARLAGTVSWMPGAWRARLIRLLSRANHRNVGTPWLVRRWLEGAALSPLERHLSWFGAFSAADQTALWRAEARPEIVGDGLLDPITEAARAALPTGDSVDALLRADLLLHLPDALLAKVDRASMLASLEARAPFLARPLVEAAAAMPAAWKVRGLGGLATKMILKRALRGVVPDEVLSRRKRGFAVPVSRAFNGRLGDRLRDRLDSSRLAHEFFDPSLPLALLAEHRTGLADHGRRLYTLLALLEWSEAWRRGRALDTAPPKKSAAPRKTSPDRMGYRAGV